MSTFPVKYFNYDFVQNLDNPTGARGQTRNISVFMSDKWYNQAPENNTITIAGGLLVGYNSFDNVQADIMAFLGYSPVNVNSKPMLINGNAIAVMDGQDRPMINYINGFYGEYSEYNYDQAYVLDNVGGTTMGYNYLGTNAGTSARATGSMWGSNSPGAGAGNNVTCSAVLCRLNNPGYDVWIQHKMLFHNEDIVIPTGNDHEWKIDFTKLAPDTANPGKYWQCYMDIYIMKRTDDGLWYWEITLTGVSANMDNAINKMNDKTVYVVDPGSPYQPPDPPGGGGQPEPDSDQVNYPGLPTIDPTALGAVKLYKLSATAVATLFAELQSNNPGDAILKWFSDPSQSLISLYCTYIPVKAYASSPITILGYTSLAATGDLIPAWSEWDMGSVTLNEKSFGSDTFLNRAPHTKISIYLPFCGTHQLDTDEVMGKTVTVKYSVDNVTGACTAFVGVGGGTDSHIRYSFSGSCALQIPLTQQNWGETYIAMATSAATIAAAGVTGGVAAAAGSALSSAAGLPKPTVTRTGSISNSSGFLGVKIPYLIIDTPIMSKPENMNSVIGFPSGKGVRFNALKGNYASIAHFHLHDVPATGPELDEIERLLKQGVIF